MSEVKRTLLSVGIFNEDNGNHCHVRLDQVHIRWASENTKNVQYCDVEVMQALPQIGEIIEVDFRLEELPYLKRYEVKQVVRRYTERDSAHVLVPIIIVGSVSARNQELLDKLDAVEEFGDQRPMLEDLLGRIEKDNFVFESKNKRLTPPDSQVN